MEIDQFCPWIVSNLYVVATIKKLSVDVEIPHFLMFSTKWETVMENLEMLMEKSWKNTLSSLWEPLV